MQSVWQQFTLATSPLHRWRETSYLHRLVGPLHQWRRRSWLMQRADLLGAGLATLVFGMAPFVPNALIGVLLIACACYWVLLTLSDEPATADKEGASLGSSLITPIHLLVLLYWAITTISTALSPVKKAALLGWGKFTLYVVLFALLARVLRSPRIRSWVIAVYLHVSLLVSVYGIHQKLFGAAALATWVDPMSPSAKVVRVYSYLGNPNLLAGYILPAIALSVAALFAWKGWLPKLLALTMTIAHCLCLYYTGSRGGWIGFVAMLFVLLLLLAHWWTRPLPRFWRIWTVPIVLSIVTAGLFLAILLIAPLRDRVGSIFAGRGDSSNNFRMNVWSAVVDLIRDHPKGRPIPNYVLGVGPGNNVFNSIYPIYQRPRYTALSAYSIPLEILVETGIVGLTCFLWLMIVTLQHGWMQLQRLRKAVSREGFWLIGALAIVPGMLGHGVVDTIWYRPEVNTLWWFAIALIASYYTYQPAYDEAK